MRRVVLALVVVFALALAGCTGSGEDRTTLTPAEPPAIVTADDRTTRVADTLPTAKRVGTPPTPEPTARPDATIQGVAMPPGTDERGIVAPVALLDAHRRQVARTDYRIEISRTRASIRNGTRTVDSVVRRRGAVDDDERRANVSIVTERPDERTPVRREEIYVTGETVFVRTEDSNATYQRYNTSFDGGQRSLASVQLRRYLRDREWKPVGTRVVDGRTAVVFALETVDSGAPGESTRAGRVVIDSDGVVHELRLRTSVTVRNGRETNGYVFDLDPSVTATVDPPRWLAAARNATHPRDPADPTPTPAGARPTPEAE